QNLARTTTKLTPNAQPPKLIQNSHHESITGTPSPNAPPSSSKLANTSSNSDEELKTPVIGELHLGEQNSTSNPFSMNTQQERHQHRRTTTILSALLLLQIAENFVQEVRGDWKGSLINYGKDYGRLFVIVDVINQHRALVD
uniref:Uncharacterized protein n=1 Tax=Solanum lycopersicum TaxID=4081 RepID=A0A3Q7HC66_SOLLC